MTTREDDKHWHLDRKVPLALIFTIAGFFAVQTATLIWWASGMTERVSFLERERIATAPQADRLTRVEVKIEEVQKGVERIERAVTSRAPQ